MKKNEGFPMMNEKELTDFLSEYIYWRRNCFDKDWDVNNDLINRARNWCITLFMAAIGFCFIYKGKICLPLFMFYTLPLIPVIWFWIYSAHQRIYADIYERHEDFEPMLNIFFSLPFLSKTELEKKVNEIQKLTFYWKNKGQPDLCRFFKKKLWKILYNMLQAEYILFYGIMAGLWIAIILFIF